MACNSREFRWTPKLSAISGFHPTPYPLGPGSTSLLALIEREFTPWSSTPPIFGASRELINCTQRNVKKRMALGVIFFSRETTLLSFSAPKKACGWAVHPFGGILPCTARDNSSRHSHSLKIQAPSRRDRSLRQALPAPRTPRWAFHRARSAVPGPTFLNLADERWTDIFHNGTSRSFPGLQRFAQDCRRRSLRVPFHPGLCIARAADGGPLRHPPRRSAV